MLKTWLTSTLMIQHLQLLLQNSIRCVRQQVANSDPAASLSRMRVGVWSVRAKLLPSQANFLSWHAFPISAVLQVGLIWWWGTWFNSCDIAWWLLLCMMRSVIHCVATALAAALISWQQQMLHHMLACLQHITACLLAVGTWNWWLLLVSECPL